MHVVPYPPNYLGGSEIFCKNLTLNLKKRKGINSEILTADIFKLNKKEEYLDGLIKVNYKKYYYNLWGKNPIVNVYSYLKKKSYMFDIIHVHSYIFLTSFQATLLKKFKKFPLILHVHGGVQTNIPIKNNLVENLQLFFKNKIFDQTIGKFIFHNSDAIISVSKSDLEFAKKKFKIDHDLMFYVPNAIDVNKFKRENKLERKYLTFIGRLSFIKGFDIFAKLIIKLYKKDKNLEFLVVGTGPLQHLVRDLQKKVPLRYYDSISYNKMKDVYNSTILLFNTSRFEGVPTTILESLSCETPVVSVNVGGISEVIENRINGLLTDNVLSEHTINNILSLIKDEEKRNQYGKNGYFLIKKRFSWEKITDDIEKIYLKVLNL
ncbi:MAG: glycosyltransferase family 4 protein [Promethearchaeota archaeon]